MRPLIEPDEHFIDDVVIERALAGKPRPRPLTRAEQRAAFRELLAHPGRYPHGSQSSLGIGTAAWQQLCEDYAREQR